MSTNARIRAHYTPAGEPMARVLAAFRATGKDPRALSLDDLAPLDEFHSRGRKATCELGDKLGVGAQERVLDLACGIGGPARWLASQAGCRVFGLDLVPAYCRVAKLLTTGTGLAERVCFQAGDATALPYTDAAFDVVWMQHASMNVRDKPRLFGEIARVLRPGGRLGLYEVAAGTGGDVRFPVPWAHDASISFLASPAALRRGCEEAGFEVVAWDDGTREAQQWFETMVSRMRVTHPSPLGLHLLLGPEMRAMSTNMARNLAENRVAIVLGTLRRHA